MKRLILFGDSLFGQFGKDLIIKLEEELQEYDVYNCAAGGWDTNDCVQKAPYISRLQPEVVVISLGTNDASPWKKVELSVFASNLEQILSSFSSSKIVYFLPPPVNETKQPEDKKRNNNDTKQYSDVAKDVCAKNDALVIDSWKIFKPMLDSGQDYHVEDGVHLNDFAYKTIIAEIKSLLSK